MRSAFPQRSSPARAGQHTGSASGLASGIALVLGLCLVLTSCSRERRPGIPPKNLLLVTVDDLRPDHLSCYGYLRPTGALGPVHGGETETLRVSFDALAASGVLFASVNAPSSSTIPSLASLLTGCGPLETGVLDDRSVLAGDVPTLDRKSTRLNSSH